MMKRMPIVCALLIALLIPSLTFAQSLPQKDAITNAFASVDSSLTFSKFSLVKDSLFNEILMAQSTQGVFRITVNVNQCIPDRNAARAMTIYVNCAAPSPPTEFMTKLQTVIQKYVQGPVQALLSKSDQDTITALLKEVRDGNTTASKSASGNIHIEVKVNKSTSSNSAFRENWTFQIVDYRASMATQKYVVENRKNRYF